MRFVKPAVPNSLSLRVLLAYVVGVILSILLMVGVTLALTTFRSDLLVQADMAEYARELVGAVRFEVRTLQYWLKFWFVPVMFGALVRVVL